MGANVIADQCSLEWEVRPITRADSDFVNKSIDEFTNKILLPKIKNNPKADIKKVVVGEVIGFDKEENSSATNLICSLTGDNSKNTMPLNGSWFISKCWNKYCYMWAWFD